MSETKKEDPRTTTKKKAKCFGCGFKSSSWMEVGPCPMCASDRDFCDDCLRDHLEYCLDSSSEDDDEEESEENDE